MSVLSSVNSTKELSLHTCDKGPRMTKLNAQGFANARLDTWKSIAQHLDRSTRTVQRWRSEYGSPVRQLGGDVKLRYLPILTSWTNGCETAIRMNLTEISSSKNRIGHGMTLIYPY